MASWLRFGSAVNTTGAKDGDDAKDAEDDDAKDAEDDDAEDDDAEDDDAEDDDAEDDDAKDDDAKDDDSYAVSNVKFRVGAEAAASSVAVLLARGRGRCAPQNFRGRRATCFTLDGRVASASWLAGSFSSRSTTDSLHCSISFKS